MRLSAEHGRNTPPPPGPAERAVQLAWLAPDATSLAALCRANTATILPVIHRDPGALLLLLRSPDASSVGPEGVGCSVLSRIATRLATPDALLEAVRNLAVAPVGFVDWDQPAVHRVYRQQLLAAHWAREIARQTGRCHPEEAWICGLLAGLGWLALAAADPSAVAQCLADPRHERQARGVQRRLWGLDHSGIARRLAIRWRLPDTVLGIAGRLDLPVGAAESLGVAADLLHVIRVAAGWARHEGVELGLVAPGELLESASVLDLPTSPPNNWPLRPQFPQGAWQNPYQQVWLPAHLSLGAELRRVQNLAVQDRLEYELDVLHDALGHETATLGDRLQDAKLRALAEFAGGAGHEINNPLAVISGQAQYLINHGPTWFQPESEGQVRRSLTTIIGQTRRIHGLLRELMLFARPSPPRPSWVDLPTLLGEVAKAHSQLAEERSIAVSVDVSVERLSICVDVEQIRQALSCLTRNALEAAPNGGSVRLTLAAPTDEWIEVGIEDNGPGPDPAMLDSIFDPFFSGRSAGRGRGLGLPVAWRLARLHRGEVRLEPRRPDGPTRFLFRLPCAVSGQPPPEARSGSRESDTGAGEVTNSGGNCAA